MPPPACSNIDIPDEIAHTERAESFDDSQAQQLSAVMDVLERLGSAFGYRFALRHIARDLIGVRFDRDGTGARDDRPGEGLSLVIELQADVATVLSREPDSPEEQELVGQLRLRLSGLASDQPLALTQNRDAPEQSLPPAEWARRHYPDYSPQTAKEILEGLAGAYEACREQEARWGPGFIARQVHYSRETVSRYLNALRKAGLSEWNGIPLPHYGSKSPTMQLSIRANAARSDVALVPYAGAGLSLYDGLSGRRLLMVLRVQIRHGWLLPGPVPLLPAPDPTNYIPSHFASRLHVDIAIGLVIR